MEKFEITTTIGTEYTVVTNDIENMRITNGNIFDEKDYVSTDFGFYPKIGNYVVIVYDWYNTVQIEGTNKYVSVGCDDIVVFDVEEVTLQISRYR